VQDNNVYLRNQQQRLLQWTNLLREQAEKDKEKKDEGGGGGGELAGGLPVPPHVGVIQTAAAAADQQETNLQLHNLSTQLDVAEQSQAQLSQDLQRVTSEKMELVSRVSTLQLELEQQRLDSGDTIDKLEEVEKEKWELSRVNQDLQQRLQQTVALAHMQAEGNESRLQAEVGKLLAQLEEEREVTARLSTSLELERRKLESLEQKSKGASGKKEASRRRSSLISEEVRECEGRLIASMEMYRQRCENLGSRISGCQQQIERDSWQLPELGLEITKLRKQLAEEKRSCHMEGEKLIEVHQLFEQVYQDYASALETIKQAHYDKKLKHQQMNNSVMENIKESNIRDNMDSLTARLMNTEDALNRERLKTEELQERLRNSEQQLESIPILEAQVEVYRSDFEAEREARQRIAGEKADISEQLEKINKSKGGSTVRDGPVSRHNSIQQHNQPQQYRNDHHNHQQHHQPPAQQQRHQNNYDRHHHNEFDYRNDYGGGDRDRDRVGGGGRGPRVRGDSIGGNDRVMRDRIDQFNDGDEGMMMPQIPLTVKQHNRNGILPDEDQPDLNCPKCGREFRNTTLLTRHVNDCLDRDY